MNGEAGKGDGLRPMNISWQQYGKNIEQIFGKKENNNEEEIQVIKDN